MQPALATRNRCDSFHALFLTASVTADGAAGQAETTGPARQGLGRRHVAERLLAAAGCYDAGTMGQRSRSDVHPVRADTRATAEGRPADPIWSLRFLKCRTPG